MDLKSMNTFQTLQQFAQSRQAIRDTLAKLSPEELTQPQVEGVWTVKDILGHLTSWEEVCLIPLRGFAQCGNFQSEVIEESTWNDRQAARKQAIPLPEIIAEWEKIHAEFVDTLQKLPENLWQQQISLPWWEKGNCFTMVNGLAWHEGEHLQFIQKLVKNR